MAFWNSKPTAQIPERWAAAKMITKAEATSDQLPPGWYYYQDGYIWYGLRPSESGGMERSYQKRNPRDLADWLGTAVEWTAPSQSSAIPDVPAKLDFSEEEHLWAEQKLTEDLHAAAEAVSQTEDQIDDISAPEPIEEPLPRKPRKNALLRCNQVITRMNDAELVHFLARVRKTGMTQSEYLRRVALNGRIVISEPAPETMALLDDLALIRAELGRQGGLLKMIIKPNEGQRELRPEEWDELIKAVRYLEHTKEYIARLEEHIDGNHQA